MIGPEFLAAVTALVAWNEAGDGVVNSALAVAFCIRNRLAAGWYSGDLGLILQGTYIQGGPVSSLNELKVPDVRDPSFSQLLGLIEGILDNTAQDKLTNGAFWWGNKPHDSAERVAQVGTLNLWK